MSEFSMETYIGARGIFSENLPFFEFRPQQLDLAERVWERIHSEKGGIVAFEAPTGLGKTFAVLVPAILWAKEKQKKVLFLTASIPLQEQLYFKDIPQILHVLGENIRYGLLKGRNNYACLRRAESVYADGLLSFGDRGDISHLIREWIRQTDTGDLSELPVPSGHPSRGIINSVQKKCLGVHCPHRRECYVNRAIQRALSWDIVISNYHLYFSYVQGRKKEFPIIPDVLICDEAHRMDDAVRSVSSRSVKREEMESLFSKSNYSVLSAIADQYPGPSELSDIFSQIGQNIGLFFDRAVTDIPEGRVLKTPDPECLDIFTKIRADYERLKKLMSPFATNISVQIEDGREDKDATRFLAWQTELDEMYADLSFCAKVDKYPEWAYWHENNCLNASPTICSDIISQSFDFSTTAMISLSATLTIDRSFEFWTKETGLVPDASMIYSSPYELAEQMEIWVADLGLKVIDKGYDNYTSQVIVSLTEDNGGNTLVLVSSRRLLEVVKKQFQKKERKYNILVQGELPRTFLLEKFRNDGPSVLIGTVSFREGIDIPGEKLTQVIIDRIPFPHPKDPLVEARNDREGRMAFRDVTLPRAKMSLKQATGRLIRGKNDRGRVVILDGRVLERKDWQVLQSLPRVTVRKISVNRKGVAG